LRWRTVAAGDRLLVLLESIASWCAIGRCFLWCVYLSICILWCLTLKWAHTNICNKDPLQSNMVIGTLLMGGC